MSNYNDAKRALSAASGTSSADDVTNHLRDATASAILALADKVEAQTQAIVSLLSERLPKPITQEINLTVTPGTAAAIGALKGALAPRRELPRCESCDHLTMHHDENGCNLQPAEVPDGEESFCPCSLPVWSTTEGTPA